MFGCFSAPPPPRKRSSRPSLFLYLDFPLTSNLTLASDYFPLSSTSSGTSTSAGIGNVGGGGHGGGDDDDG